MIRGKKVEEAQNLLSYTVKTATGPVRKLLDSALANARQKNIPTEGLFVEKITVDGGSVLKRGMPRARGSMFRIKKRTSIITLILGAKVSMKGKK